ncbi:DUF2155 domain-containing protein [Amylibacter sp.]|nr:DUF2155 domain-containing protein [Amylibacter sp.]MDB4008170.1 DUF2155 domain-containing protein [Amylibacter sp.]MDB4045587.1 DUF2155 domain-containing protein [Amylibacter sp.]
MAQTVLAQGSIKVTNGSGALLRTLDRLSGNVADFKITNGEEIALGNINVLMKECRYPSQSIDSNAFAFLVISGQETEKLFFEGWMISSSPALSALEHPRYDVWVLKCIPYLKGNFIYQRTF